MPALQQISVAKARDASERRIDRRTLELRLASSSADGVGPMFKKRTFKDYVRVAFVYPAKYETKSVHLVGDFNAWNTEAPPLVRSHDGRWQVQLDLEPNCEYQFRYLVNGSIWENDAESDGHASNPFGSDNSIVSTANAPRHTPVRSNDRRLAAT
jgi:hypothetical protein